jgi:predicted acetyltransferase
MKTIEKIVKIRTVRDQNDIHQVSDLISKVYNYRDYYEHYEDIILRFSQHPEYKFSDTVVAEINNEIVGHLKIVPQILKFGSCYIKSGGFAGVCVKTPLRKKGIARMMIEFTLEKLEKENYDVALLFGIPDFYHRFGFVPVFKEFQALIEVKKVQANKKIEKYQIKDFEEKYSTKLWKIYHKYLDKFPFFPLRSFKLWDYRKKFLESLKIIFLNERPIGYLSLNCEEDNIKVEELMSRENREIYKFILNYLKEEASKRYKKQIKIYLPGIHPFFKYLKGEDLTYQIKYRKNSFALGKILNFGSLFSKLLPELSKNLKNSPYSSLRKINFCINKEVYTLDFENQKLRNEKISNNLNLKLPSEFVTQILFGYDDVYSLSFRYNIKFSREKLDLLNFLFPPQNTLMFPVDRF